MEEEYQQQNLQQYELRTPAVLKIWKEYMVTISETANLLKDDYIDPFAQMVDDQRRQEANSEESKAITILPKSLLVKIPPYETKLKTIEQLLERITFDFDDPKYSVENNIDTPSERMNDIVQMQINNQKQLLRKFEAIKDQQKAKFLRYQNEDLKEEMLALDGEIKESFLYSLQYSQAGRQKEIQIKHYDLQKLNPPNYLNDTIINFYLKVIENLIIPIELKDKVYIFNTYFMDKLCPYDKVSLIPVSDTARLTDLFLKSYESIKKWVKEDLFSYQYLLFPLNLPEHWSLIIVSNPNCILDENKSDKVDQACIVYLDSFGIIDQRLISIVKMYLHKSYQEKTDNQISYSDSMISKIPAYQLLVPRQINYIDCGAFLLEYAESFLNNPSYLLEDIQNVSKQTRLRLFPRVLVNRKRYLIKKLILNFSCMSKEEAITIYKQERQAIFEQHVNNIEEYDEIEPTQFEEFLLLKTMPNGNSDRDRHSNLLDFYMNPLYNYYHNEQLKL